MSPAELLGGFYQLGGIVAVEQVYPLFVTNEVLQSLSGFQSTFEGNGVAFDPTCVEVLHDYRVLVSLVTDLF